MKPGILTTEFWVTLVSAVVTVLVVFGIVSKSDAATLSTSLAQIATALVTIVANAAIAIKYIEGRHNLKSQAGSAPRVPLPAVALVGLLLVAGAAAAQCPGGACPTPRWAAPQGPRVTRDDPRVAASVLITVHGIPSHGGQRVNALGSGTVVAVGEDEHGLAKALVLTCRHVVPDGDQRITVRTPDGRTREAFFVAADDRADLAALVMSAEQILHGPTLAVPIAAADVPVGARVSQVGYPHGRGPIYREGTVRGYVGRTSTAGVLGLAMKVQQGDSGSGVFANGQLVGVVWGGSMDGSPDTSASGVPDINRFLEKCFRRFPRFRRGPPRQSPPSGTVPVQPLPPSGQPSAPPVAAPPSRSIPPQALEILAKINSRLDALEANQNKAQPPPIDEAKILTALEGIRADIGQLRGTAATKTDLEALKLEIERLKQSAVTKIELEQKLQNLSGSVRVKVSPRQ